MSRGHCISLSDRQLALVQQAAGTLPVQCRDPFLRRIADRLRGEPSDEAVMTAIDHALSWTQVYLRS